MMEWDEYREVNYHRAVDEILNGDHKLIVDEVINESVEPSQNREYAMEILYMSLNYATALMDENALPDEIENYKRNLESAIMEAPFFENLVDHKLNEMWDMGN
jgi:hypothetical protein